MKHTGFNEGKNGTILTVQVLEQDIEKYKKLGFVEDDEAKIKYQQSDKFKAVQKNTLVFKKGKLL